MSDRKRGPLSGEDRELWERVKKSARPLKPARRADADEIEEFTRALAPKKPEKSPKAAKPLQPEQKPSPKSPPPLAGFDRRMKSRVARGHVDIGARIDLHGLTLERAHRKLEKFLFDAQEDGVALALVITGKGRGKNPSGGETGALRREVPMWLSEPRLRALVIGFEEAAIAHGGSGALYVRIRRPR
jgi:DNA-nicking Smr family endonuclease